jgi:hypothetical protein
MRVVSLRLTGTTIEDAFLYRTFLYCWTFENRLRIYSIDAIERAAQATDPDLAPLINYSIFHSRGIGASSAQRAAWRNRFELRNQDTNGDAITLDGEAIPYEEASIAFEANSLLDLLIFYDRLYIATDAGLFSVDEFESIESGAVLTPVRRVRDACYSASAGLGTVAASCGPGGLRLLFDESRVSPEHAATRKAAAESLRAELGYSSVVNHRSRSDIDFLSGTVTDTSKGRVLTDVRKARVGISPEASQLLDGEDFRGEEVAADFTIWDYSRLIVFMAGGVYSVSVGIHGDERSLNRVRRLGSYPVGFRRVISASRVGRSFAVESDEAMAFVAASGVHVEATGPVVSSRSYPRSHRYRRAVTATSGRVLWLFGVDAEDWPGDYESTA